VTVEDNEGGQASDSDEETVTVTDVGPDIRITKTANPASVPETGGNVTFTFLVENIGQENVTLTSLTDTVFGDLNGQGDCATGGFIPAGGSTTCAVTVFLASDDLTAHTNVVTAVGTDNDGSTDEATDKETVTFDDVAPAINVTKTAAPASVPETGGDVTFTITVENVGTEPVTLTGAVDTVFGPIDVSLFDSTYLLPGETATYAFVDTLAGEPALPHQNVVTVTAQDNEGTPATGSDDAEVTFTDVAAPEINVTKTANPSSVPPDGGNVTFTFLVENTGQEDVTLTSLTDTVFGDLNGQGTCSVPQTILAGDSYSCQITTFLSGGNAFLPPLELNVLAKPFCIEPPTAHYNVVTAVAVDNEGTSASDTDDVTVTFDYVAPAIQVSKTANKTWVPETGDNVTFTIRVKNTGTTPVTLTGAIDTVFGPIDVNLFDKTYLGMYEIATYSFTEWIAGEPAVGHRNVVTVTAQDNQGVDVTGSDDATVTYGDKPPRVDLTKTANPLQLTEPGGDFTFTLTIHNPGLEPVTIAALTDTNALSAECEALVGTSLAAGESTSCTYTVTHTDAGTYNNVATVTVQDNENNTASDTDSATVTVLPEVAGQVVVTKTVDWNGFTPDPNQTFQFCITGPSFVDPSYNCQTVGSNGGSVTWNNLLPGLYTITETPLDPAWVVVTDRIQKATIVGGDTVELGFTNRYNPPMPALRVEGMCAIETGQVTFTLFNDGSAMSEGVPYTITNDNGLIASSTTNALGAGESQVFEPPIQTSGGTMVFQTSGSGGLYAYAEIADCFPPVEPRGHLAVTKTVYWNGAQPDPGKTFEICITGPTYPDGSCMVADYDGATLTWYDLTPGSYTVTETDPGAGWTVSISGSPATVVADQTASAIVTNTHAAPDISVTKTANPTHVPETGGDVTFTFVVTNVGAVDVTLTSLTDNVFSNLNGQGTCVTGGLIPVGNSYTCAVTYWLSGSAATPHTNTVTAVGTDIDGASDTATDDETVTFDPAMTYQGCTPGYWKQKQHFGNWTYPLDSDFDSVFGVNFFDPNITLVNAVKLGGGGVEALARHAVAALLNAANPNVAYPYSVSEVIAMVQDASATGNYETVKNLFEAANEAGCPLGRADLPEARPDPVTVKPTIRVAPPVDSDGDGLTDDIDMCPHQASTGYGPDANGCPLPPPDSDGDGLTDDRDACPAQGDAGYGLDANGCPLPPPDSDGDSLTDERDACPAQGDAGYGLDANGCPLPPPDSDGDGVTDERDACPAQGDAGYGLDANGCPLPPPDSDGDSVGESEEIVE